MQKMGEQGEIPCPVRGKKKRPASKGPLFLGARIMPEWCNAGTSAQRHDHAIWVLP